MKDIKKFIEENINSAETKNHLLNRTEEILSLNVTEEVRSELFSLLIETVYRDSEIRENYQKALNNLIKYDQNFGTIIENLKEMKIKVFKLKDEMIALKALRDKKGIDA